jgi:succinyl-diaminopimelate desuccinylase
VNAAEQAVLAEVDRLKDELVEFTCALVRVPTINPPGAAYADCADLVAGRYTELGYAVEILNPACPSVVGTLGSGGMTVHFNGHYDVVPPGRGWTVDPFAAVVRDGRIYGRGSCDQKGGIAASLYAVEAVRRAGVPLNGTVEQSATPDEETGGSAGVGWLCDTGRIERGRQDYVVITEPLDPDRVCVGHRGVYWFQVTTLGRVGHGSMPGLAANAAESMLRVLQAIDSDLRPRLAARRSNRPVEPPEARQPSISLNALHAGQPVDTAQSPCVPDCCTAIFDRRFIHEESFEDVRAEIVRLLDSLPVSYELQDLMRVDPLAERADSPISVAAYAAIQDVLRTQPTTILSPGTYDHKHIVRRAGLENACIGYGPGRLVLAHQPDEFLAIDDLVAATRVMSVMILRLLG